MVRRRDATTATVKARIEGASQDLHLRIGTNVDWQQARRITPSSPAVKSSGWVATFAIDQLQPDTRYFYALADGERQFEKLTGEFRTFANGSMSFTFAFASCAGGSFVRPSFLGGGQSNHEIFEIIEKRRPHFMLHMGDLHYHNIESGDIERFRKAYESVLTQDRQASLFRHVPIVYMWDDHDYCGNNSDRRAVARESARDAYMEHVPHYPLDGKARTIQQEFTVGRVRFIVSDLRFERDYEKDPDGENKSMLGSAQREWLVGAFKRAVADGAPLVFWVSSVPWITKDRDGDGQAGGDGWKPYASERRWLADRIAELGLTQRLVMLSGDAHMVAIDDGTHSNYASVATDQRGFPVVQAAPLDRRPSKKGGPYSHGISQRNHQFGWADVQDDGTTVRATLSGHSVDETQLRARRQNGQEGDLRLQVVCRDGVCTVIS